MPWFRVDDALPAHRKVLAIPRGPRRLAAIGAWTFGGAWSSANLTEGRIPRPVLTDLGIGNQAAKDLLDCGLWLPDPDGYLMHDYLKYNPTAEQVRNDRAAAAERQRRAREKAREKARLEAEKDASHAVSHGEVTPPVTVPPTRPDPTRPSSVLPQSKKDVDVKPRADHNRDRGSTTEDDPAPVGTLIEGLFGRSA